MSLLSTNSNSEKNKGQSKAVWAVFFASVISFMGFGLVDPILPAIANQLGASPSEVTLLFTSYNAVMAIAMIITGFISTRIGIKKTLLLGVVIIALFSTLSGLSNSVWTIIWLRGFWGLGNALFIATALTALVALSRNGTAKSVILYEAAIGLGFSVGPLFGGLLGEISWSWPFLGVGILMIVAFISLIVLMPNSNKPKTESNTKSPTSLLDPFRAMKHRPILVFGIAACLYNFGFFTLIAYAPFIMDLDAHGIGFVFFGWGILVAITSVFMAPKLQHKFGAVKSMYTILILFAIVLLVMGIWTSIKWVIIASIIISGALIGNSNTLLTTAVMSATSVERSTVSAAYSFLRFIGAAIAPFTAGMLAEVFSPHVPFIVAGCLVFGSVIILLLNRHYIHHVDRAEEKVDKIEGTVLKVKDFMIPKVVSIQPGATIKDLLKLLIKYRIGGVPVVDNQNKLIGIVSDGDIIRYLVPKEGSVHDFIYDVFVEEGETEQDVLAGKINTNVSQILAANITSKKQLHTVKEEDTFEKAMHILSKHHFKKLPVIDREDKVIGIISRRDINNSLLKMIIEK
jgi:MFS transporter, ACDE family, multidrug resistance protein